MAASSRAADGFSKSEIRSYGAIFVGLLALDLAAPFVRLPPAAGSGAPDGLFGFSQLRWPGLVLTAAIAGLFLIVSRLSTLRVFARWHLRTSAPSHLIRASLAGLCGVGFFIMRSWFINPDGALFPMKFLVDVPTKGFHATHDEMWELYIHSKFWLYTQRHFGWNVLLSYQVLSCAAGAVFVFLLLTYLQEVVPRRWSWAFLACISGGYIQLFFGDAENYTLTTTLVMAYFLASLFTLDDRASLVFPSLLLAAALMFHLEAGFLLPSLAYVFAVTWRRGKKRQAFLALIAFVFVIAGTLLFFHVEGLPISDLFSNSHAFGDGGHFLQMLSPPSVDYYFQIANLAFLLVPAWVVVLALVIHWRIKLDAVNIQLILASAVMTIFVLGWKAQLGVYNDWNLFAMAAVPISLLAWRNVFNAMGTGRVPWSVAALIVLFFAHSYSWVIANHLL